MLKKISNGCVHIVQRYLPDPFIFCILLTIVVFIAAIPAAGATPLQVVGFWGTSIWSLLAFSMQMALVLVLGTAMLLHLLSRDSLTRLQALLRHLSQLSFL